MKLSILALLLVTMMPTVQAQAPKGETGDVLDRTLKDATAQERERRAKLPPAEQHFWAGLDRHRAGKFSEALTAFEKAVALNPKHSSALIYRGMTLLALRRPVEALASLDRGLATPELKKAENKGWLQQTRYYRAAALLATERTDEAIAECGRSLELGANAALYLLRGEAYMSRARKAQGRDRSAEATQDLRSARADLEQAVRLSPTTSRPWATKATVHFLLNEEELACQAVTAACSLGDCRLAQEFSECKP